MVEWSRDFLTKKAMRQTLEIEENEDKKMFI